MSEVKPMNISSKFAGVLSEMDLKKVDGRVKGENDKEFPCQIIRGNVVIENQNGTFNLNVYCASKTKKGEDNPMFDGYETIMKSYVSKAEAAKKDLRPDFITCNTQVSLNDFVDRSGRLTSAIRVKLNGANRVKSGVPEGFSAINMEGVIFKMVPEKINEQETGRLCVEFMNVAYGSVAHPYDVIVPENLVDDFMDLYRVGDTCSLSLELKSSVQKKKSKQQVGFGNIISTETDFTKLELIAVGGTPPYDEDDVDEDGVSKVLSKEAIKKLYNERAIYLEELKNKDKDKKTKAKSAAKTGLDGVPKQVEDDNVDYGALF